MTTAIQARSRAPIWILAPALVLLLASALLVLWRHGASAPPSLNEVRALARQKQFDLAQERMTQYLQAFPRDGQAHLLMAHLSMDRPDPQPELALKHLGQVQPASEKETAIVCFSEGKAYYQQQRYDLAEIRWRRALELDPAVPEAGWALFAMLDMEGRAEEAHKLGMKLYEVEPDPRDRSRLLLELIRLDVERVAPGSVVQVFEPVWKEHPESLPLALLLGLGMVHNSQGEEGIEVLRDALRRHPDSIEAWDAWLTGLDEGHRPDLLRQEFDRLPRTMADDPRFAKHEGSVAQARRDWPRAVAAYRRAYEYEPFNGVVLYRWRMALRGAGNIAESEEVDRLLTNYQNAFRSLTPLYLEIKKVPTLGLLPHPDLCHRLAAVREQMGRFDEARAWHRLVLRDAPDDPVSLAALSRLK
jgi:tetratricopeptide (TPR) repeat protein